MSLNPQTPYLYTITGSASQVLTITNARAITCLASGGVVDVVNSVNQTLSLPDTATIEITADSGNTLAQIVITPRAGATALISMIAGNAVVTP
jgi:hypothetical protein